MFQDDYGLAGFRKATDLKKTHPHLKVRAELIARDPTDLLTSR